jgi:hypothetical protein
MARHCHSCERALRKGASRRAWVLTADGAIAAGIVCGRCALRAVAFVVPPHITVPTLCTACKRAHASICAGCADRLGSNVRELSAANVALAVKKGGV